MPKTKFADRSKNEQFDQFALLLKESNKFCKGVGLPKDLILQISTTDSDWGFILKIDALFETASKHVVRHGLRFKLMNKEIKNDTLGDFVDALPMAGRTSLLSLMEAAMFSTEDTGFIEATRRIRNAYAHNIRNVDVSLIDLIKQRSDKTFLLKNLSPIGTFEEKSLLQSYEKDPGFLRFMVMFSTMRILMLVYHMSIKRSISRSKSAVKISRTAK